MDISYKKAINLANTCEKYNFADTDSLGDLHLS